METAYKFLEPMVKLAKMEDRSLHLAQYVLELSLLDIRYLENKPSLLASSALYLVNKIRRAQQPWPHFLELLTGYSEK
jgi:cyclin B